MKVNQTLALIAVGAFLLAGCSSPPTIGEFWNDETLHGPHCWKVRLDFSGPQFKHCVA